MAISNRTLIKIASIGGIITCTTGVLMQWKIKDRVRQTEYYKEAFKTLRSHSGAVSLLGEPIKEGDFSLRNKDNHCNDSAAHFQVNVKGPKQTGTLYFWADKNNTSDKWNISRIELGLEKEPDRRLLIKNVNETV
ncbi:uncharacterized protein CBL_03776 [Carabus blaptoides fortunei]